jgi:hypothetical protein
MDADTEPNPDDAERISLATEQSHKLTSAPEALPRLVFGSVFKTDGASRKRAPGGFDSRALPLC